MSGHARRMNADDRNRFKKELCRQRDVAQRVVEDISQRPYLGGPAGRPLEHTTRHFLIDPTLRALGWKTDGLPRTIVEEARIRSEERLYADCVGINPRTRAAVLLIEAKASHCQPPRGTLEARNRSIPELLSEAVRAMDRSCGHRSSAMPLSREWMEWLGKLRDYTLGLCRQGSPLPRRVVITSGIWMIVITEPALVFAEPSQAIAEHFVCFADIHAMIEGSAEICDLISHRQLVDEPPEIIEPHQLALYASPESIGRVVHGLWVRRGATRPSPYAVPRIEVSPAIVVELTSGSQVRIIGTAVNVLPQDAADISGHIEKCSAELAALRKEIEDRFGTLPRAAEVADVGDLALMPGAGRLSWVYPSQADEFLVAVGSSSHFLLHEPTHEDCLHHDWANSSTTERAATQFIGNPSVKPPAYFPSKHAFHCASRVIHDMRRDRCHLSGFETFLCCRACTLAPDCWKPEELERLPCAASAQPKGKV